MNASTYDRSQSREVFEASADFTVGLEEEFALLDPSTLSLTNAFEGIKEASEDDDVLADAVAGELISSEIEIRSGRGENFADAHERQRECRRRLFALAGDRGVAIGSAGLHPWSPWQEQRIIDTPHYRRVEEGLKYVAWRNNAFSIHVHVGMRGADRAVAVCDTLRPVLPTLLAASANSAFTEERFSGLHSTRTQIFTRMFPRCGVPDFYGGWEAFADYVDLLFATKSIIEHTQIWWSVRPHLAFGTVEIRIMDAQTRGEESIALLALATACAAQAGLEYDLGRRPEPVPARLIEENVWRAIRYGMDGDLIDFESTDVIPARAAVERLLDWTRDARSELKLDPHLGALEQMLESGNGAQRQWRRHEAGESIRAIYADGVAETCSTFAETAECVGAHSEEIRT